MLKPPHAQEFFWWCYRSTAELQNTNKIVKKHSLSIIVCVLPASCAIFMYPLPECLKQHPDWNHVEKPFECWVLKSGTAPHVWTHDNYFPPSSSLSRHYSHTVQTPWDPFMNQKQRGRWLFCRDSQACILMLDSTHRWRTLFFQRSVVRQRDHSCA